MSVYWEFPWVPSHRSRHPWESHGNGNSYCSFVGIGMWWWEWEEMKIPRFPIPDDLANDYKCMNDDHWLTTSDQSLVCRLLYLIVWKTVAVSRPLFPKLFQVANGVLCIPATSSASERVLALLAERWKNDEHGCHPDLLMDCCHCSRLLWQYWYEWGHLYLVNGLLTAISTIVHCNFS